MNIDTGELRQFEDDEEIPDNFVPITEEDFKKLKRLKEKERREEFFKSLEIAESYITKNVKTVEK